MSTQSPNPLTAWLLASYRLAAWLIVGSLALAAVGLIEAGHWIATKLNVDA